MRNYQVYIIRTFKGREKILSFPIRGESEEDVKKYVEEEFLPSIKRGEISLCNGNPYATYEIDKITLRFKDLKKWKS